MFEEPAVAWETSLPPTTPRGTSRSSPDDLTSLMGRTLRLHPGQLAAGDVEHLAVDVVRPRRAQEEDAARRLLRGARAPERSEEHTSELQSRQYLVCRLLLEKK